jgi:hypothetical protein
MAGVDHADGARSRAHRQGLRQHLATLEPDPAQELAVGDPGRGEEDVVSADEVVDARDPGALSRVRSTVAETSSSVIAN